MTFEAILDQAIAMLQRRGRVAYSALKRQFALDEAYLEDLKDALLFAHPVADQDGRGLVWTGEPAPPQPSAPGVFDPEGRLHALLPDVMARLQRDGRVRHRTLQYVFGLDDALLEAIRRELMFRQLARDEQGEGLVWAAVSSDGHPSPSESARNAPEAERRQLTVMFCDLVGSTDLAGRLDPEDWREVVRAYQEAAAEVIQRYEGHIAQYLGDGLLVYFGFPMAHEDDAQRAVHTGLGVIEAMGALNTRLQVDYGVELAVRIGVHTGPVVVGEIGGGGRYENLALGETPNIAARLEGLAAPNAVVISAVTARLAQRAFDLENLGLHELKGVAEPMMIARVLGPASGPAMQGFEALVGRDEEIGLLLRRWEQAKEGVGQVIALSGEAGIGKSSLVEGLRRHVRQEGHRHLAFRCSPYHTNSALHPIIDAAPRALGWQPDDAAATRLAKLEQAVEGARLMVREAAPLMASLLSLALPEDRYPALTLSPQQQRQQTQDTLVGWLQGEAERQALLVVWEDLHWADPSTLELLGLLLHQAPTAPILHLLTFRPEFEPPWPTRSHMTPLVLQRLERPQIEALMTHLAQGKKLPLEVSEHILAKTDGVPLYVEELTKMILDSDLLQESEDRYVLTAPLTSVAIPDTLQDSLMARLDQMRQAKEVAQLGAVIGREFAYEMIRAIAPQADETLQAELAQLVEAELLYRAGERARDLSAYAEALVHLQKGMQVIEGLPETPSRWQRELTLLVPLGDALRAARGHSAEEVGQLYDRARQLCQRVGDAPELLPTLSGLRGFYSVRGEHHAARDIGEHLLRISQQHEDPNVHLVAYSGLLSSLLMLGELSVAKPYVEQSLHLIETQLPQPPPMIGSRNLNITDPGVNCLGWDSQIWWLLGYPDRAWRQSSQGLQRAQAHGSALSMGFALFQTTRIAVFNGDVELAREQAEWMERHCTEYHIASFLMGANFYQGLILALQGQPQSGIEPMQRVQEAFEVAGHKGYHTTNFAWIAEALMKAGQWEHALTTLEHGFKRVQECEERLWEAEFYRLKGELLSMADGIIQDEKWTPEDCFRAALEVARRQQTKSLELRAASSLARLWQSQGKRQDAYDLLAPVYGWFTEGFDTTDLMDAKMLLTTLAPAG